MKKSVLILLVLLALAVCACGKKQPEQTVPVQTVPETTIPEQTQPELDYVTAQINGIPAVLATFSRGDTLDVVQSFDERHYVVKLDQGYGLVEKNLIRLETEAEYTPWTGYAQRNARVYDNYRLAGDPVRELQSDTRVEVLDDLGWCVLVRHEGAVGYMRQETLAKNAGSNSGTRKNPAGDSGEDTAKDGGEISLRISGRVSQLVSIAPQKGNPRGTATVLADNTNVVLGYFDRGDQIPVLRDTLTEDQLTVCLDGLCAFISGAYVRTDSETWEGRSEYNTELYDNFWMQGNPVDRWNAGVTVTVLYELDECFFVEAEGTAGYVRKNMVKPATEIPELPAKTPSHSGDSQPAPTETTGSENDGHTQQKPEESGGQPPQTKPSGGTVENSSPEWTPPML